MMARMNNRMMTTSPTIASLFLRSWRKMTEKRDLCFFPCFFIYVFPPSAAPPASLDCAAILFARADLDAYCDRMRGSTMA